MRPVLVPLEDVAEEALIPFAPLEAVRLTEVEVLHEEAAVVPLQR